MSDGAGDPAAAQRDTAGKLIDPTAAMRILRATDADRDALIERYGLSGRVELEIADELAAFGPLADPAQFGERHRRALHAIEVLDRNGARQVTTPRLGPLGVPAAVIVGLVTRWVVRQHQARLIRDIRRICERREAISDPTGPEHALLRRARFHTAMVEEGYHGNPVGLPAFVVGGALLSGLASAVQSLVSKAIGSTHVGVSLTSLLGVALLALSWCALYAAGVARRRIRMTTDGPMRNLWAALGSCGRPPKDQSLLLAIVAIVLAATAALAIPFLLYFIFGN